MDGDKMGLDIHVSYWRLSNFGNRDEPGICKNWSLQVRPSVGEEIMTLALFVFIQYQSVTDRQTDRQTDGRTSGYTIRAQVYKLH